MTPNYDLEAEKSVLGAVLLAESWFDALVVDIGLVSDDFYRESHRHVYGAMKKLRAANTPIDTLTVKAQLKTDGQLEAVGGKEYVETLVERIPSIANTKRYGQIVKDLSLSRGILRATQNIQEALAGGGGTRELVDLAQREIMAFSYETEATKPVMISDAMQEELDNLERIAKQDRHLTGTPSGFAALDGLTAGWQSGNLIVLAARPSMGKSALAGQFAVAAAGSGYPTAFVTLEMSRGEVVQRMIALKTGIENSRLRRGRIADADWRKISAAATELANLPLWIDDAPGGLNVLTMRSKLRRLDLQARAEYGRGLGLVLVDYLQLIRAADPTLNRNLQVSEMVTGLKSIARELNVPVIAMSQLSREVERRRPPRPVMSDLRDSGDIEHTADVVAFIYREDYYKRDTLRKGAADLIVAKHRNGPVDEIELGFVAAAPKFISDPLTNQIPSDDRAELDRF